jgi:hypothetical protein
VPGERGGIDREEGQVVENLLILQVGHRSPLPNGISAELVAQATGKGGGDKRNNTQAHYAAPHS